MKGLPRPPANLKPAGKDFWKRVLSDFVIKDHHDLERLAQACACLDLISEAEAAIERDGLFQLDRYGQTREHCALKVIRDNRTLFLRAVRELGLDLEAAQENRPPRKY